MRVFVGFDDTDTLDANRGTGKLARWFETQLPEGCRLWGVVRQQLLIDSRIPYTSHNSAACAVIDMADTDGFQDLVKRAEAHIKHFFLEGSDPGLCLATAGSDSLLRLTAFGYRCTRDVVVQKEAMEAASGTHLSGHGGTNDGIIGAAAAVGLTASGNCGRFIEFNALRDFPHQVSVADIQAKDIRVVSIDRDARIPCPDDVVATRGWVRPMLLGHQPVFLVRPKGPGRWENLGEKRRHSPPVPDQGS
jgi:hypothetical protein